MDINSHHNNNHKHSDSDSDRAATVSTGSHEGKDDIYEVQEIVGMKTEGDITVYRVRWKGYGPQSDTWEPESNLRTVWRMIERYKARHNSKMSLLSTGATTTTANGTGRRRGRPSTSSTSSTASTGSSGTNKNSAQTSQKTSGTGAAASGGEREDRQSASLLIRRHPKQTLKIRINNSTGANKRLNPGTGRERVVIGRTGSQKKRLKYSFVAENGTKNTFWKDLEDGKIDVFKEDLYSRVKSRAASSSKSSGSTGSSNSSADNSPKQSTPDSGSPVNSDTNDEPNRTGSGTDDSSGDSGATDATDCEYIEDGDLRVRLCKTEALVSALKAGDRELARILIDNGSDVNSTTGTGSRGSTPLMICAEQDMSAMAEFLLSVGAHMDSLNKDGDTALIIASRLGHNDIIKLLLTNGSNFAQINRKGMNALRIARTSGHPSTQLLLIDHISRLALSLEDQVMATLRGTARIVNALFPIQCYSVNECQEFKLSFQFDLDRQLHRRPGVGYILFCGNTTVTPTDIKCQFCGPDVIQEVLLNKTVQKPLTEGAQYVFSFLPLVRGTNELVVKTVHRNGSVDDQEVDTRHTKLLVCAYELQLITGRTGSSDDTKTCDYESPHN